MVSIGAYVRDLHIYEAILAGSNVSLAIFLNGSINEQSITLAYRRLMQEHPIARMKLAESVATGTTLAFYEDPELEIQITTETFASFREGFDWRNQLIYFSNGQKDHTLSMVYLKFVSAADDPNSHILFVVMNHSAMDGPGILTVFKSFSLHLANVLSGQPPDEIVSRPFEDILSRIPPEIYSKDLPQMPPSFLDKLSSTMDPSTADEEPMIFAVFDELNEDMTSRLIQASRVHGTTIQGIISTASALGFLHMSRKESESSTVFPQTLLLQCPMQMRGVVEPKISNDDCVCGSAALWWVQEINESDTLWDIATKATEEIKRLSKSDHGLIWWSKVQLGAVHPFSVMSSSIGINPIQSNYNEFEVTDVKLMGSAYKLPRNVGGTMVHVHTFNGRLNTTFNYVYPYYNHQWGTEYASIQQMILHFLINDQNVSIGQFFHNL